MSNGDCFFSAIYRALIYNDKYNTTVQKLNEIYSLSFPIVDMIRIKSNHTFTGTNPIENEMEFVIECRKLLSTMKYLDETLDYLEKNTDVYSYLLNEYNGQSDHIQYYLQQRGRDINTLNIIDKTVTLQNMKEILKKSGSYVGNEEFTSMRNILSRVDIQLLGPFKNFQRLPKQVRNDMILLYNPNDVHYQYIVFQ